MMAGRTAISFEDSNRGLQVGQNSGPIHAEFHLPQDRPETPPKPSFNVPFRRDVDFVERKTVLDQIHQTCLHPASRVALLGLGGVGKSQLAIEYAYRARDRAVKENREVWVFWVYAETLARVEESFRSIADTVKIPGRNQPQADIYQLVYQWLRNERNGQWLMVLDSADDLDVFYHTQATVRQTASKERQKPLSTYLPQSSNGSILVTTRNRHVAFQLTGSYNNIIDVGPMDQEHALVLLARKSREGADMDMATQLVEALENIPLAISQAAAYIQRRAPRMSISKYLEEFRRSELERSSLLNYEFSDLRRDESAKNGVITTWQISFNHISSKRPSAADLLCLMSFFDRQGIFEWLIQPLDQTHNGEADAHNQSLSSSEFEEDIEMLRDYCLVKMNETGDVFEMHGLVQLSTRKWLDATGKSEEFMGEFISRLAKAFPSGKFENWDTCRKLFPHAEKAGEYQPKEEKSQKDWALLLYNSSWYACEQGKYTTSEAMARMSHDMNKMVLGPEHPDTLTSMDNLASTYWNQGRWKEAELLEVQVLEIRKTVLGPKHPDTLTSMANLASTYWNQGRLKEAELLEIHALEMEKTVLGPEHPSTLSVMANLAMVYGGQGRWKEAELLQIQVLEIRKTVLGPEHPDTLTSVAGLAYTWKSQGRNANAIRLLDDVIQIHSRVLGTDNPEILAWLSALSAWQEELELSHGRLSIYPKQLRGFF
ncbi:P-loop containing nucleoside triphosphate hydrolase protein [Nemania sp. NC0429]|nr:P-loop containing nucleoside triphosphate hydrolase protein [Nemania sp. NC0429]